MFFNLTVNDLAHTKPTLARKASLSICDQQPPVVYIVCPALLGEPRPLAVAARQTERVESAVEIDSEELCLAVQPEQIRE